MAGDRITLVDFDEAHLPELVTLWRASFERGVGVTDPHPIEEQRQYFLSEVLPQHAVRLALKGGTLAGFAAATPACLSQLYVRVEQQRQGVGATLLGWAKSQSSGSLWLHTFARNLGARCFYEKHGFVAVAQGFEPVWQLADIRYEWTAAPPPGAPHAINADTP